MPWTPPLLYEITDTALDIVHVGVLQEQIVGTSQPVEYIDANSQPAFQGLIAVYFANEVSDADKAIVDAAIAAHQGKTELTFKATATLVPAAEVAITEDLSWQTIGGVVSNIQFFIPNLAKALGRVQGVAKAVGTTVELRIVERDPTDGSEIVIAQTILPAVATFQAFAFSTDVAPRPGTMEFRLEGRLNGATSAALGFVSMTLLEAALIGLRPSV